MAMDRRQDDSQKDIRYMEIRIVEINRDAEGVRNVVYSYVANVNKKDVFENRYRHEQAKYLDLLLLQPMEYYLITAVNLGTEKRTKWVWYSARRVSQQQALSVFKIRERKPSRNYHMPLAVEQAAGTLGVLADDAYGIWKNNHPDQEPTFLDLLVAADSLRTRMSDEFRTKWAKTLKQEWDRSLNEERLKELMH